MKTYDLCPAPGWSPPESIWTSFVCRMTFCFLKSPPLCFALKKMADSSKLFLTQGPFKEEKKKKTKTKTPPYRASNGDQSPRRMCSCMTVIQPVWGSVFLATSNHLLLQSLKRKNKNSQWLITVHPEFLALSGLRVGWSIICVCVRAFVKQGYRCPIVLAAVLLAASASQLQFSL